MRNQHALLIKLLLLPLPLFIFFSPGVYAKSDRDPRGDISVGFGLKFQGVYTIQQKRNGRYVDAYTNKKDFALITRPGRDYVPKDGHEFFVPPTWVITPVGDAYTIQQKKSRRFIDAHEIAEKDFALVTRPAQNDDTQRWIISEFFPEG